jgi:hypothetical protein
VKAVTGIFGEVPKAVFTGSVAPRHTRRRVNLSEQELALLQKVAEGAWIGSSPGIRIRGVPCCESRPVVRRMLSAPGEWS